MKAAQTESARVHLLTEIPQLDPVRIILMEPDQSEGRIIIECYGRCWSAYFRYGKGGMLSFVAGLGVDYLSGKFATPLEQKRGPEGRAALKYLERVAQAVIDGAKMIVAGGGVEGGEVEANTEL